MRHYVAHLAVLALADREHQPDIGALVAFQRRVDRSVFDALDLDALLQLVELCLRDLAMGTHAVAPQPAGVGQLQRARKPAVIGKQQEPLGVEVEPADADQSRQAFRQIVEHRRPPLGIVMGSHQPARLVIEEQPRALARRQRLAVDRNHVIGGDVERRRVDDAAVDGDAAGRHHFLGIAARGEPGAGQHLGDALACLLRLRLLAGCAPFKIALAFAIGAAATKGGALGKYPAVVLIVAARPVGEAIFAVAPAVSAVTIRAALAARMLLPVHPTFRALAPRPIEVAIATFSSVTAAIPARTIEFRAIRTIAREARAITAVVARAIVPLPPRLHLAAVAALEFPAAIAIAKIPARTVGEFAVGEPALRAAFAALATRRAIVTIELRPIATRLEVPPLTAPAVIPIKPLRPVAELAVGETALGALAARRAIIPLEPRSVATRLEVPPLAAPTVVALKPRRARPVAMVAARRTIIAVCAKRTLAALALPKTALGELLLGPPCSAGAALAPGGPVTPAAGIVVFVFVAGHERSHSGLSQKACAPASGRILTQNRYPLLLKVKATSRFLPMIRGIATPSFMDLALKTAENTGKAGEVPIGCVIVRGYEVIATAGNRTLTDRDPTAHAEILAIREAAEKIGTERLVDCDLYVTLEPCTMCAAAISFARIRRLYYGAADPKGGAVDSGVRFFASPTCHHVPEVYSAVGESEAATLLKEFFRVRR